MSKVLLKPASIKWVDFTDLDGAILRPATPRVIDFTNVKDTHHRREDGLMVEYIVDDRPSSGIDYAGKGSSPHDLLMTTAQARRRARRKIKKGQRITDEAFDLISKPVEEWDDEELARGRPRNAAGDFRGMPPKYLPREIHERALERFKTVVKQRMNYQTLDALRTVEFIMTSDETDDKGKPVVSANVKLQAAQFLIEHLMGKPTQPINNDISVKLQGILGTVMVNPQEIQSGDQYKIAHMGYRALPPSSTDPIDAEVVEDEDDLDE